MNKQLPEQDHLVAEFLKVNNIRYNVQYLGYGIDPEWKESDNWLITFNTQVFRYNSGTGYRVNKPLKFSSSTFPAKDKAKIAEVKDLIGYGVIQNSEKQVNTRTASSLTYAIAPTQASVLYCLLSDADCGSYSFNDFCDSFGYDNDSMKAFDIYKTCMKTKEQLYKVFTNAQVQHLQELLQDY